MVIFLLILKTKNNFDVNSLEQRNAQDQNRYLIKVLLQYIPFYRYFKSLFEKYLSHLREEHSPIEQFNKTVPKNGEVAFVFTSNSGKAEPIRDLENCELDEH